MSYRAFLLLVCCVPREFGQMPTNELPSQVWRACDVTKRSRDSRSKVPCMHACVHVFYVFIYVSCIMRVDMCIHVCVHVYIHIYSCVSASMHGKREGAVWYILFRIRPCVMLYS